jgi:histidyl-tRNA synthetase
MADLIDPVTLRGFRDFLPDAALSRKALIRLLEETFESFGFVPIDTPVLEYSEVLLGKGGGETEKQVYRFFDHGNRDVALRYDLTVPFARYMAGHRSELYLPFKRYHIAKVWRGENTQRGRYREFLQCDFDIVGCDCVSADFEILLLMAESMKALGIEDFHIEYSHRGIFNRFLHELGLEDFAAQILRTVDKLKALGKEKVADQLSPLTETKKVDRILDYISTKDSFSKTMEKMIKEAGGEGEDTERVFGLNNMIDELSLSEFFVLNPSITRGLDYYTGIVFETYLNSLPDIGSVCSGGRYNNLASLYSKEAIPGVGSSIGLDRLQAALNELNRKRDCRTSLSLIVLCLDDRYLGHYHRMASTFRKSGIGSEVYPERKKLSKQFQFAEKKGLPLALICGEDEIERDYVTLKDLRNRQSYERLSLQEAVSKAKELLD